MAVVGVAVNWLVAQVLHRDGGEGHNIDCSVTRRRHVVRAVNRNHVRVIDGCVSLDGFQTEQLSETVRSLYCSVAHGVAWAAVRLGGRSDLDAIQAIFPTNGRRGRFIFEKITGRTDLISGGDYGNSKRYRIHGGYSEFL